MNTYYVGTQVFCDFHFGNKPRGCVVEVIKPGDGRNIIQGLVRVKLTETIGAYRKDDILTLHSVQAVPCEQEIKHRGPIRRLSTNYQYLKSKI